MTGTFEATIAELKTRRDKIDSAIAALEELGGETSKSPRAQEPKSVKTSTAVSKPKGVTISKSRKVDAGGTSNRDLVIGVLREGPKRAGAIIKALKGKVTDQNVYQNLSYMKAKGEVKKNREDATFELTID